MRTGTGLARVGAVLLLASAGAVGLATLAGAETADPVDPATTTTTTTTTTSTTVATERSPATTVEPSPPVQAAAAAISGWVADGNTGQPLDGICVVFYYSVEGGAWDGQTITDHDGYWTFTPAVSGAQQIAVFRPSTAGDCSSLPVATGPVPEWVYDVSLTPADPLTAQPPQAAALILDGTDRVDVCLGDTTEFRGGCDRKLTGTGTLSGTVVQTGPAPVAAACVYVLTDLPGDSDVGWNAMTDTNGRWEVTGLPTDRNYYVGVVAPFETAAGPCETENGPPPAPSAGELQPEFYANSWVDLTSPDLDADPAGFAAKHGAVAVDVGATGVDVCLTTDPGSTTARPECTVAVAEVTSTGATTGATAAGEVPTATTGTLPLTGRDPAVPAALGGALVATGAAAVLASRRKARAR